MQDDENIITETRDQNLPSFGRMLDPHNEPLLRSHSEHNPNQLSSNYYKSLEPSGSINILQQLNSSKIELQKLETDDSGLNSKLESSKLPTNVNFDNNSQIDGSHSTKEFFDTYQDLPVLINQNFRRK